MGWPCPGRMQGESHKTLGSRLNSGGSGDENGCPVVLPSLIHKALSERSHVDIHCKQSSLIHVELTADFKMLGKLAGEMFLLLESRHKKTSLSQIYNLLVQKLLFTPLIVLIVYFNW